MSAITVTEEVRSLQELVAELIREHRVFPQKIQQLNQGLADGTGQQEVADRFVSVQNALTHHMVTEEFDFYPVLMERGLFDETVSAIMQQYHEISADLNGMEIALRVRDIKEFKVARRARTHTQRASTGRGRESLPTSYMMMLRSNQVCEIGWGCCFFFGSRSERKSWEKPVTLRYRSTPKSWRIFKAREAASLSLSAHTELHFGKISVSLRLSCETPAYRYRGPPCPCRGPCALRYEYPHLLA